MTRRSTIRLCRPAGSWSTGSARLLSPGWTPQARRQLEHLILAGRGRRLPVAFDFDNTIVCGDIGEATLAILTRRGLLSPDRAGKVLSPPIRKADGSSVTRHSGPDATVYYEALLAPTVHGTRDPTPLATGYVWAVEAMAGLRVRDVVRATAEAYACSATHQRRMIDVSPGRTSYPAPFFYPEMVELLAVLIRHDFEVWIVSASNVWSVRWMVQHALQPLLRGHGVRRTIPPERVLGISVLVADRQGGLHKDACLVRENRRYAALDPRALCGFRLTGQLQFPVPTYSGKVGCLWDVLDAPPFLAAGDSPGDHSMLSFSRNRLWIARLDKPAYQAATAKWIRRQNPRGWILQPVLTAERPSFVSDPTQLGGLAPALRGRIRQSLRALALGGIGGMRLRGPARTRKASELVAGRVRPA